MKEFFKIGDVFIYIFALLLVIVGFLGINRMHTDVEDRRVIIEVDGKVLYDIPLTQDPETREIRIDTENGGYNIVVVTPQGAYMKEANCPDKVCIRLGFISKPGETIVCLPHRVVVRIAGEKNEEYGVDDIAS